MKKIIALLLALVMAFSLVACGSKEEAAAPEAEGGSDLNIGVFYYTYDDVYISSVRAALDAALTEAGLTYTNNDSKNDQALQNEQVQTAIANGANLLVVNLVNSGKAEAAQKIVDMADGIPVVFFNRAVEGEGEEGTVLGAYDYVSFIGTDAPEAGHMQGKMVGDYVVANYDTVDLNGDGTISYAMFKGQEGNAEAEFRTQYGVEDANAVLEAAGKPAMVYFDDNNPAMYQVDQQGAWSTQAALDYMNTNLASFNEANDNMIEVIICNNDGMAEGVVKALNAAGYNLGDGESTTIPVYGVDATASAVQLITDGKMTGTVKQDAEGMAEAINATIAALSEGKTMTEAVAAAAAADAEKFSIAEGIDSKLFVAYAPYTAE